MFRRVRFQISALALTIVVCIYAISAIAVYSIVRHAVLAGVDAQLVDVARSMPGTDLDHFAFSGQPGTIVLIQTRRQGAVTNMNQNQEQALQSFLNRNNPANRRFVSIWKPGANLTYRILEVPLQLESGARARVAVGLNIAREMAVLDRLGHVLWIVGAAGLVISAIAGFFLAEWVLRPIRKAWQRQLEFVGDASHELRTPLAVIQSNLGLVLEHTNQSVMDNLEWIHNAHGESRRLAKLVEDLLTLARSDAEKAPIHLESLVLSELAERVAELFEPVFAAKTLTSRANIQPDIQVIGDKDRLHQLLVILIDNACKFTPAGGTVEIRVHTERNSAILQVVDSGSGIAEKDLPRIFDRFYQADASRTHSGSGLGLSIAQWITDAHKGKISVASKVGTGTTFTVLLPLTGHHSSSSR